MYKSSGVATPTKNAHAFFHTSQIMGFLCALEVENTNPKMVMDVQ